MPYFKIAFLAFYFCCLYVVTLNAYVVSGSITLEDGSALSDVNVRISNIYGNSLKTDLNGLYSIELPNVGKPHMVAPQKTGYTFEPAYFYIKNISQPETIHFVASPVPTDPINKKMIYYYINWGIYARDYNVRDIPVENITHINYAFVMPFVERGILQIGDEVEFRAGQSGKIITVSHTDSHSVGLVLTDEFADIQKYEAGDLGEPGQYPSNIQEWLAIEEKSRGVLGQLIQLKKAQASKGKDLKLIASIGGWTLSQHFPAIAEDANFRTAFGEACFSFLEQTGFDGIDLDWEFPLVGGTDGTEQINGRMIPAQPHTEKDPVNMLDLFKAIREEIGHNYELSIACAQAPSRILTQYVWPGVKENFNRADDIMEYLDYVNTMTYDYGGYWSPSTSHNAPLYKDEADPAYNGSVSELIDILLAEDGGAVPPEQLIMGLGYYGRAVKDVAPGPNGDGLYQVNPYSGPVYGSWDVNIPDREAAASLDFADLKFGKALNKHHYINQPESGFVEYWNDVVKLPYLYNPNKDGGYFVSYDDENSLAEKVRFLNSRNLGGAMVWEITQDTKGGYLTQIIYDELISSKVDISGKIIGLEGMDLSGILVSLSSDNSETIEFTTNSNGAFAFEDLRAGKDYVVSFYKEGYSFNNSSFHVNRIASDQDIQVYASDTAYSIHGYTKHEGSFLEVVTVKLWIEDTLIDNQILSGSNGSYRFVNVPGGFNYTISAEKEGYENITGSVEISDLEEDLININFDFELAKYSISGIVKNNFNQPLEGALVRLSGDHQANVFTNKNGFFTIPLLNAFGSYTVQVMDEDKVFTPSEKFFDKLNSDETVDFIFDEIPTVSGYLKNGDEPVSGVTVVFSSQISGWYWVTTLSDENGYFEFVNVPLGEESSYMEIAGWQGTFYPSNRIDLGAISGSHEYVFNLDPDYVEGFDVDGYIREGQMGLAGVQVIAQALDSLEETVVETDESGYYQFTLEKDKDYRIRVEKEYYAFSPEFVAINQLSEALTLEDFQGSYLRSSISGHVVFEGQGLSNVQVQLTTMNAEPLIVETDSQGNFEFLDLEKSLNYIVWFSKPNFNIPFAEVLDLDEPQNLGDLSASFFGSRFSISGTISDESNLPMEGVQVFLSGDTSGSLLTDLNGEFAFDDLMEGGSYQIAFSGESLLFTPQIFEWNLLVQDEVVSVVAKESTFTPLPEKVIVGYWHNWDNASAPHIRLSEVAETKYNVCDVSFIETWKVGEPGAPADMPHSEEGAHPKFSVYNHGGNYTEEVFKEDIKTLQASGIPVLISIGGQNGHVELNTEAEKDIYVQGVIDIVEEYGFDGIDIDYEGGSMTILNSPSDSLDYAAITDPELKYGIDAIREIKAHFGDGFLITTAPELYYVQEGRGSYPGGSQFIAFLHNIRDILDLIHVQYYNFGTALWSALDGTRYNAGDVDLVVAMTDMLISGFPLTNGLEFPGLREDQVAIGLPCVPNAAGGVSPQNPNGYYFPPAEVIKALDYLTKGIKHADLDYTLEGGPYPDLRGIMTWSINWDKSTDGGTDSYEFANAYDAYFESASHAFTQLGTPHYWFELYGLISEVDYEIMDLMDSDGDGYQNFKEYIMGTNPIDRLSSFKLLLTGKSELTWSPVSDGRLYELQWTNSLTNPFQTINEFRGSETDSIQLQNTDQDKGFYRIQIKMDE